MNVVLAGYRSWAYNIFKSLTRIDNKIWQISGLITTKNAENDFQSLDIPILIVNPQELDDQAVTKQIKIFKPDIFLFYGWSWMIPKELFSKYLCLALHPSPLPKYRGGSPLQHQIIRGENKGAVTIFKIGQGLDDGPIYSQTPCSLEGSLSEIFGKIVKIGIKNTVRILNAIAKNTAKSVPQDESKATIYKRRLPRDSELAIGDFQSKTAKELYNIIRALDDPYPNAYIVCRDGKKLFLKNAQVDKEA